MDLTVSFDGSWMIRGTQFSLRHWMCCGDGDRTGDRLHHPVIVLSELCVCCGMVRRPGHWQFQTMVWSAQWLHYQLHGFLQRNGEDGRRDFVDELCGQTRLPLHHNALWWRFKHMRPPVCLECVWWWWGDSPMPSSSGLPCVGFCSKLPERHRRHFMPKWNTQPLSLSQSWGRLWL